MATEMEEVVQSVIEKLGYDSEGRIRELEDKRVLQTAKVFRYRFVLKQIKQLLERPASVGSPRAAITKLVDDALDESTEAQ